MLNLIFLELLGYKIYIQEYLCAMIFLYIYFLTFNLLKKCCKQVLGLLHFSLLHDFCNIIK